MQSIARCTGTENTVLLVIDTQVGLVELMSQEVCAQALPRMSKLLAHARASGTPVIHVQHDGGKGHPLETGTAGWKIHEAVKPLDGELVVRKRESDSFFETSLQQELANKGIRHLVVAGAMTEFCVDTTCRRATSLGYDVTLVGDAHLTRDTDIISAAQIIAHHNLVLNEFGAGEHVIIVKPAAEIIF
jgi:nicotinamidase-related amidase